VFSTEYLYNHHFKSAEMMMIKDFKDLLDERFGQGIVSPGALAPDQNFLIIYKEKLVEVCQFLYSSDKTYFDSLSCITGVDNGTTAATIDVVYNLYSIPYNHHLMLKVELRRNVEGESIPEIPSLAHIWRTADWLERETYDLMGINFTNHPDLRRILLPADWAGHPLRKDYSTPEKYHGIKVDY
jgi:NADH-quinone oxidoreductase subunit C